MSLTISLFTISIRCPYSLLLLQVTIAQLLERAYMESKCFGSHCARVEVHDMISYLCSHQLLRNNKLLVVLDRLFIGLFIVLRCG